MNDTCTSQLSSSFTIPPYQNTVTRNFSETFAVPGGNFLEHQLTVSADTRCKVKIKYWVAHERNSCVALKVSLRGPSETLRAEKIDGPGNLFIKNFRNNGGGMQTYRLPLCNGRANYRVTVTGRQNTKTALKWTVRTTEADIDERGNDEGESEGGGGIYDHEWDQGMFEDNHDLDASFFESQ